MLLVFFYLVLKNKWLVIPIFSFICYSLLRLDTIYAMESNKVISDKVISYMVIRTLHYLRYMHNEVIHPYTTRDSYNILLIKQQKIYLTWKIIGQAVNLSLLIFLCMLKPIYFII